MFAGKSQTLARLAVRALPAAVLLACGGIVAPAVGGTTSPLVVSISTVSPSPVDATHSGTFTVTLTNTGAPQSAPSVTVAAGMGGVTLTGPSGWACAGATCDYSSSRAFKNGASAAFTGSLTAPDPAVCAAAQSPAGSMLCPIGVTATSTDDNLLTSSATVQTAGAYPDIAVSAAAPVSVAAGQVVAFTATLTNTGSGEATGVTLTDSLPALAAAGSYATFVPTSSSAGCAAESPSTVVCAAGALASGGSVTVTVAVLAPPLAVDALDQQLGNGVSAADSEEGANPVTAIDDSTSAATAVYDGFSSDAGGGSATSTPGLGGGHDQTTIVTLSSQVTGGQVFVDDSLASGSCVSTGAELFGNPVTITSPVAPATAPNTVQMIYDSGPGGIPAGEPLGSIQVTRQADPGADQSCFILPQCGLKAGKAVLPTGDVACVAGVKRQKPTGVVTITLLDTGGDPSYRGSG